MNLIMAQFMKVNGIEVKDMERVNNIGMMVHSMKVIGEIIWQMEKVD